MLQPVYVFVIFVLKRNVINVILGRDKRRPTKSAKTKDTNLTKKSIIKNAARYHKDSAAMNHSNPAFSITTNKDTESVILLSATRHEDADQLPLR